MPDTKVSALTDGTTANSTDRLPAARTNDGGATWSNVYVTPAYIKTFTSTGAQTFSVGTVNGTGLDISQTWTGTGTYTGLKYNVGTDSGPANAASLLLDLQVGGTSQFSVSKAGTGLFAGSVRVYGGSGQFEIYSSSALSTRTFYAYDGGGGSTTIALSSGGIIGWGSTSAAGADSLILRRADTATLQLGAADTTGTTAPTPQKLRVQSWSSSTNNNQLGADFTIQGSRGTGTGAGGSIIFQVAPAGGSSNGVQNAYATALTIGSDKTLTFNSGGSYVNTSGTFVAGSGVTGNAYAQTAIFLNSTATIRWSSSASDWSAASDVILASDTSNTLALRNGTSAQKFRVYNTYTSSTSYENFEIDWQTTANIALVGPTKGSGGGTQRVQRLQYLEDGGTGSTTPSLGTTCPAASATIKSWIKVITSDGTTAYIPCWA